jgi:hypothetical protein
MMAKFISLLFTTFLISNLQAEIPSCEIKIQSSKVVHGVGIVDWDEASDKMVMRYPEIQLFGSDLVEKVDITLQLEEACPKAVDLTLKIFAYEAPYQMLGGEETHELHGSRPQGKWLDKPFLEQKVTIPANQKSIELKGVNLEKLWSPRDFFWHWSIRFDWIDQKNTVVHRRDIHAPLQH